MVDCQESSSSSPSAIAIPPLPSLLETPIAGLHPDRDEKHALCSTANPFDFMPASPKAKALYGRKVMSPGSTKRLFLDHLDQVQVPSLVAPTTTRTTKKLKRSLLPPLPMMTMSFNTTNTHGDDENLTLSQQQQQHKTFQQALIRLKDKSNPSFLRLKSLKEQESDVKEQAEEWAKQQVRLLFHASGSARATTALSSSPGAGANRAVNRNVRQSNSSSTGPPPERKSPLRSASYHPASKTSLDGPAPPLRGRLQRRNSARAA